MARDRSLLADLVAHLKTKVDAGSVSCVGPYRSALESLASLDREAAKGAQVHSRIRWVEEGESSSSYFLRLEKKRAADRWIPALRESGGSIVSSPEGLCRTLNTIYSDLFSSVPTDSVVQASLLSNFPCPLPCDQARVCVKVPSLPTSVSMHSRTWPRTSPQVLTVFRPNFTSVSGMFK